MPLKDILPKEITPADVYYYASRYMKMDEIDHHGLVHGMDDLYLKVTPVSREIVSRLTTKALLSTFHSNLDGSLWYDLPFCYNKAN